jgi:hypothetical protein
MSCLPTCSSSVGGIAYPQSAQGNVKSKGFRLCGACLPFYCLGTHHSPDSCNVALVPFLTAQLKKCFRVYPDVGARRSDRGLADGSRTAIRREVPLQPHRATQNHGALIATVFFPSRSTPAGIRDRGSATDEIITKL